jgi:monovalent cation/proton antiporter MnhG/PhaG subunit
MEWRQVAVDVLLALTVLLQLVSAVGLLAMPNLFDRIHYLGPASAVAPWLLAAAVVVTERLNHQGIVTLLLALFLAVFQPMVTHATARAARIREHGDWRVRADERVGRP